jgi:hypothetical protein
MSDSKTASMFGISTLTDWSNLGQAVGGFATAVAMVATAVAAWLAYRAIVSGQKSQRELDARTAFRDYLSLAVENPAFANGFGHYDENLKDSDSKKYEWYVAYMLNALDGIVLHIDNKSAWNSTIEENLKLHVVYFSNNDWFNSNYKNLYNEKLGSMISAAINQSASAARGADR